MKLLTLLALLVFSNISAQDSVSKKPMPNYATIKLSNGSIKKGWLYRINDDQLVLLRASPKQIKKFDPSAADQWSNRQLIVPIENIQTIAARKRNAVQKASLIGMGAGILIGAVIGFASGDDEKEPYPPAGSDPFGLASLSVALSNSFSMTAGEKAVMNGAGLGLAGAIIGGIIGTVAKKKFILGGNKQKFHDLEAELRMRLLIGKL